jgi:hypothetical protein
MMSVVAQVQNKGNTGTGGKEILQAGEDRQILQEGGYFPSCGFFVKGIPQGCPTGDLQGKGEEKILSREETGDAVGNGPVSHKGDGIPSRRRGAESISRQRGHETSLQITAFLRLETREGSRKA